MADQNTALPIRSPQDADQRVQTKVVDFTTPAQGLTVDSSGAASTNETKIAGTAVAVNNGSANAGTQRVTIADDSTGQVRLAAGAATIGSLAANQSVNVNQIAGTTTAVNTGNANAGTQRVVLASDQPTVSVSLGNPSGTLVEDFKNATAIAVSATDNHDYTVTALTTLTLKRIYASASGKAKMEVSIDFGAGLVLQFVQFNSTANPNMEVDLLQLGVTVAAGLVVRVAMTNLDLAAQNLYSTINGTEN